VARSVASRNAACRSGPTGDEARSRSTTVRHGTLGSISPRDILDFPSDFLGEAQAVPVQFRAWPAGRARGAVAVELLLADGK